jgi:hypothetical protein
MILNGQVIVIGIKKNPLELHRTTGYISYNKSKAINILKNFKRRRLNYDRK